MDLKKDNLKQSQYKFDINISSTSVIDNISNLLKETLLGKLDIVSKSLSGFIFFIFFDFILGGLFSLFTNKINALFLTEKIISLYQQKLKILGLNVYFFTLIFYLFLWSWGKFILFLSKVYILDNIKGNYDEVFKNKKQVNIEILKPLREKVINKLKSEYSWLDDKSLVLTDYILYLILGTQNNVYNKSISSRSKLAEETAFYLLNIFSLIWIINILYLYFLFKLDLVYLSIISLFIILIYPIIFKIFIMKYTIRKVASIYISRNIRLYLNFLKLL